MLFLHDITYILPNRDTLFTHIDLALNAHEKMALTGNNGTGKSTLLRLIAGELAPAEGTVSAEAAPYYVPQIFGQFNALTVAAALRVDHKIHALHSILNGDASQENLDTLADDWTIEERCAEALAQWQVPDIALTQKMETLSGGQKTKVFLAGISIHQPSLILLDEPSNHLDAGGRALLYDFIKNCRSTLLVVSHDRILLNLLDKVCELDKRGLTIYGGNYDFYLIQKENEKEALLQDVRNGEKELRKAREKERETLERQQKLDARGKQKQEKAGVARIMMNTLRNNAEKSTSKLKSVHSGKTEGIATELSALRAGLPDIDKMKFGFENSGLHKGKIMFSATHLNHRFDGAWLWKNDLDFQILSGDRLAVKGLNGSGKTTLIRMLLGELEPQAGQLNCADTAAVYVDQDYSLLHNAKTIYEQALQFNEGALQEHEIKTRLNRFLFGKEDWDKPCGVLSGGEKMRLTLCCLTVRSHSPDLIVLDEPTNNLDIQNIEILTAAINEYQGTLIVVSHDRTFLDAAGVEREILLE